MYGKGFLGNMTENLQTDCVQSRQAGFMQCFLYHFTKKADTSKMHPLLG